LDKVRDYAAAGVDISRAQESLALAKDLIRSTHTPNVLSDVGEFGGMYLASFPGIEEPVLVASIDGVGTKTSLAVTPQHFEGIGADIVNHCVNDILAQGARPLFFLDYFGASKIEPQAFQCVLKGVAAACKAVGCALLGGETAEMPDVYSGGAFELAGCIVGVVSKAARLPRPDVRPGDALIALGSTGLHTNGYTLARRVLFETLALSPDEPHSALGVTPRQALLATHRCYLASVSPLLGHAGPVKGIAHITGGGLVDNVPRMLPAGFAAYVDRSTWKEPALFGLIRTGGVSDSEMLHVFNLGVGLVMVVERAESDSVLATLRAAGDEAWQIGEVVSGECEVRFGPGPP
jgi:phosphoribosylformylglycinamidine cyclo-ligase